MSVLEVLKTRIGIKSFMLPIGDGNEILMAFEYIDKKTEVHSLNQECVPLYLEENTRVSLLNLEQSGTFLLAATPSMKQGKSSVVFRLWDSSNVLGFAAREIQIIDNERQITQDGKFKCHLNCNEANTDISSVRLDSLGPLVALRLDNEILVWKAAKKDPNIVILQICNSIKLKASHLDVDIALLQVNGQYTLVAADFGCLLLWSVDRSDGLGSKACPIPQRSSGTLSIPLRFIRVSKSNLVFNDDGGKVWAFSLTTNSLANIKLPGLHGACNVFTVTNRLDQKGTILAVGNEGHAINIYDLGDLTCDRFEEVIVCERPLKILFSIAPVDALGFIKQNFIAMASISNRTLTLWRILATT